MARTYNHSVQVKVTMSNNFKTISIC